MNYTKLNIEGQDYGLKFGMPAARYMASKSDNPMLSDGDELTEIGVAHVIYGGYLNNCAHKDIAPELTFEQVADHVESCMGDSAKIQPIVDIVKVWMDSKFVKSALEQSEPTTKKKTSGTKLKG